MRAMILAAGRGKRLRPLTDELPKPLLKIGGKPLIEFHLEALAVAGFREVVINQGHLGDTLPEALETGHGVHNLTALMVLEAIRTQVMQVE